MTAAPTTPELATNRPTRLALPPAHGSASSVVLWLGDCADVLPLLKGGFDAVITDPPYGVNNNRGDGKVNGTIEGDSTPPDVRWMADYPAVIWGANNFCDQLPRSTGWLVWYKYNGPKCEHSQCELAWTNLRKTIRYHAEQYSGFMRQRDGWYHPNQKPPKLMAWAMQWLPPTATVIDPYMGSGTTGIACVRTGRSFVGIEKDAQHYQTAVERIRRELNQGVLAMTQNTQDHP